MLTFDVHSRTDDDCDCDLSANFFVGHLGVLGCFVVLLLVRVYYNDNIDIPQPQRLTNRERILKFIKVVISR